MAERFYTNCPLQPGPVILEGPEAHHLATVRRFAPGDLVCLFNGDGREYPARIVQIQRRRVALEVTGIADAERETPFHLEIAAPLPKGDRGPFLVEKLTELGVTRFIPLQTQRSVVHPRETRIDKLQRQVIEASKQCGRNVLMTIAPLTSWETYCRREDVQGLKVLAHPRKDKEPTCSLRDLPIPDAEAIHLAVGPEGGFTDDEVAPAVYAGWRLAHLGPRTLRIETAALLLAAWAVVAMRG
jgi:16S rRNA (uracil1498-N3)-methyltransferase